MIKRQLVAALCLVTAGSVLALTGSTTAVASSPAASTPAPTPEPVAPKIQDIALTPVAHSAISGQSVAPAVLATASGTKPFQTVGITWAGLSTGANLAISVRTHSAHGWTAWQSLGNDDGDDPTAPAAASSGSTSAAAVAKAVAAGVRGGTDPLWVGPSDGAQARIAVTSGTLPPDLKLELVDAGTSPYDATAAATAPGATVNASAITAAAATTTTGGVAEPAVLSRAQWGADESKVRGAPVYMPTIKGFVMHHTAGPNNYTAAQVPAIIRGDYAYHLSRGWNDIGYNALVDRFGRIWEGRAGGLSKNVMGAHAGGFNDDTFGVSVIGNYDTARPTAAAVDAVARIMAWKLDLNHRDPMGTTQLTSTGGGTARWPAGVTRTFNVIMGHRDTGQTDCPGAYLYPYLASIRSKVKAIMQAALLNPSGPPSSVAMGTPVSVQAKAMAAQSWALTVTKTCGGTQVATVTGTAKAGGTIVATWNGLVGGTVARPGEYTLTLTSKSSSATARPVTTHTIVDPPAPVAEATGTPSRGTGGYVPVTPATIYDTRTAGHLPIGPKGRIDVPVLGQAGVPASGVSAVVLDVTTGCLTTTTSFTAAATGAPTSLAATAVPAGVNRTFLLTSRVGANGEVSLTSSSGVSELSVDVVGYYTDAGGAPVRAVPDTRIYDAAPAQGSIQVVPLPATIDGVAASEVSAVMVDVSALGPKTAGSLSVFTPGLLTPGGAPPPALTFRAGETVDNLAIVPVANGAVDLEAIGGSTRTALDVRGLVLNTPLATTGAFTPIPPKRAAALTLAAGKAQAVTVAGKVPGVPATARAVLVNLTALAPAQATTLQAYAAGGSPAGAALRAPAGDSRGNLLLVPLGAGGAIDVLNAVGSTRMSVDVYGYVV